VDQPSPQSPPSRDRLVAQHEPAPFAGEAVSRRDLVFDQEVAERQDVTHILGDRPDLVSVDDPGDEPDGLPAPPGRCCVGCPFVGAAQQCRQPVPVLRSGARADAEVDMAGEVGNADLVLARQLEQPAERTSQDQSSQAGPGSRPGPRTPTVSSDPK
jgi:hypothetical protein